MSEWIRAALAFFPGEVGVQGQQAREHPIADLVRPPVAPRFLLSAQDRFLGLMVEQKQAIGQDAVSASGVETGAMHGCMKPPQPRDPRLAFVQFTKAAINLCHAFVVADHHRCTQVVSVRVPGD